MANSSGMGSGLLRLPPVLLIVLMWTILALLDTLIASVSVAYQTNIIEHVLTAMAGLTLSLGLYAGARRLMSRSSRFAFPLIAALALLSGSSLWAINILLQYWFGLHSTSVPAHSTFLKDYFIKLRYNWMYFTDLFILQAVVFGLLNYARTLEMRDRELVEARLAALRFQLNPHFLFNTLNAIATMVTEAATVEAEQMITRLSNFLRISLSTETTGLVSLAFELDTVQAYLDIESVRFGDRLDVRYACAEGLDDAQVPSLILQPLVENAIKYAVAPSKRRVTLSIEANTSGEELVLIVRDDGQHKKKDSDIVGTGVGLRNVSARLEALYGRKGQIETIRGPLGFTAIVRLPLHRTIA